MLRYTVLCQPWRAPILCSICRLLMPQHNHRQHGHVHHGHNADNHISSNCKGALLHAPCAVTPPSPSGRLLCFSLLCRRYKSLILLSFTIVILQCVNIHLKSPESASDPRFYGQLLVSFRYSALALNKKKCGKLLKYDELIFQCRIRLDTSIFRIWFL